MLPNELSYILNELGEDRENYFNSVAPPIIQTSNFAFKTVEDLRKVFENEMSDYIYTRGINPTTDILRKKLAALDGAEDALIFNSGASAIYAAVLANVSSGDHIISVDKPYTWARKMFDNTLTRFKVATTYIDGRDIENFDAALQLNTRIIYLESPNSWDFVLQDLEAVAAFAKKHNLVTIIDNSFCTPLYQRPIEMGIDLVLQSATKYIGGHSDVVAGVLTGKQEMIRKIFDGELMAMGNGISPFNAWLLLRGLRTLPMRLEKITSTTIQMIEFLKSRSEFEEIIFPLDPDFPQYELAKKQMSGACGLVTVVFKPFAFKEIVRFIESLQHILIAVSWGGYESLAIPYCASIPETNYDPSKREHRMVRFYFGLEEPSYLQQDINQALEKMRS
ncbi:MAG: trans-sulfuration enzyme family protein [Flavitalea sp.]